jgi:hypothetical protein
MKQVFALRACAPPGGYLRVRLQGKVQQQWEDARLYVAVRWAGGPRRLGRAGGAATGAQSRGRHRRPGQGGPPAATGPKATWPRSVC